MKKTVWYPGSWNSWYFGTDGVPAIWPWDYVRFRAEMAAPRWEEFGLTSGFAREETHAVAQPRIFNAWRQREC